MVRQAVFKSIIHRSDSFPGRSDMQAILRRRAAFVVELARRLHQYGTTASRFEMAVAEVAATLDLRAEVWSSPTAIILSFYDPDDGEDGLATLTQVLRVPPGDVNLRKLCAVDRIADQVIAGDVDVSEGRQLLRQVDEPMTMAWRVAIIFSYGLAAACVAVLLRATLADAVVAGLLGLIGGALAVAGGTRPRLAMAVEALSAFLSTTLAIAISALVVPIAVKPVVLASLIVLIPGMSLTTAIRELSTQQLMSGTARLAGATASLLKLAFGVVAAASLCSLFGLEAGHGALSPTIPWIEWPAVLLASLAFAILFQAARRDWLVVMAAVAVGYTVSRFSGLGFGPTAGVFAGGLVLGAASNAWARWAGRPGAMIREPGVILLVPGSVGFRSMSFLMEQAIGPGANTGMLLVKLLVGLVAGLLIGDLLISPRRNL